jgi:5-methyltetrahydrofolate--homocysteine methyltransferase
VGVVLACNNYEVIDLGVMVQCDKILDTALEKKADMIGLSGLITPSLDEMVHVAKEMKRRGIDLPLLIGGATTSRQHTAVKIAPVTEHPVVHVLDASRAVGVMAALLDAKQKDEFVANARTEQAKLRAAHASLKAKELVSYPEAVARRPRLTHDRTTTSKPAFTGVRRLTDFPLGEIARYIDWTFFFTAWELRGKYPRILEHPEVGPAARELFDNGNELLRRIVGEKLLRANAVYGFWPAQSDGDDIVLYTDETRSKELARLNMLRQQTQTKPDDVFRSLADFVAPVDSNTPDWVGGFAVTTGLGADELADRFKDELDDYNSIMVKALADRLAEAFAELLHARARREWGYGNGEDLGIEALIDEKYRGIRPAFGYPACPDHTEKVKVFDLLDAPKLGITLTETLAISPAASVSGIYLGHPESRYFNVGRVGRDQVDVYAARKGTTPGEVERWLSQNLAYDPR